MFGFINKLQNKASAQSPRLLDAANNYDLNNRPFTRALILRAAQYQDVAFTNLKRDLGRIQPQEIPESLDAFAAMSATSIAHYVTTEAAISIGRDAVFLPTASAPNDAPFYLAFSLFFLAGVHGPLTREGIVLSFEDLAVENTQLFFMFHDRTEKVRHHLAGVKAFQLTTKAAGDVKQVEQWHDNLMKLIPLYVLQWNTDNEKLKAQDFMPVFGQLLSSLLKVVK